jgi:thymidylate synthase/dihydrofolate reductase
MVHMIVAMDLSRGIGKSGHLPWHIPRELALFKQLTMGSTLLVGRKTAETLPPLTGRQLHILSRTKPDSTGCPNLHNALRFFPNAFVIGGKQIYEQVLPDPRVSTLHLSLIKATHDCDTYLEIDLDNWTCTSMIEEEEFNHYTLIRARSPEVQYLKLLRTLLDAPLRESRNSLVRSQPVQHLSFDLQQGFPLLTTKKMFFRGIVEELLFFLRGDTDTNQLSAKGVRVWEGNTTPEFIKSVGLDLPPGEMGPMYGYQWRNFNGKGLDQLQYVVTTIRQNPTSRRILMTSFNPEQVDQGVLWPCHSITLQFFVRDEFLDMFCYNRSSDVFLGLPFNIASSALLLHIIAGMTFLKPGTLHLTLGDAHLYANHEEAAREQTSLLRIPRVLPTLKMNAVSSLEGLELLQASDFTLQGYRSYAPIKAKMIA